MNGLEIKNLAVDFGNFKLDATLNVPRGCVTGLVGRNGAGKSTLIKAIMRQQEASGSILYNGIPFFGNETEVLRRIACVFDSPHFSTYLRPKRLLKIVKGMYPAFDEELYGELMEKFALPGDKLVRTFSTGMKRKFGLILALCQKPDILLLDEPTAGIDPYDRGVIIDLIQQFMLDEGHTVLFSTHITEDLDKIADYIVFLQNGKVLLSEEKETLCETYRLVQAPELTDGMREEAIGVQTSMFGYTFLTRQKNPVGEGLLVKTPTVEEIFIHLLGEEEKK